MRTIVDIPEDDLAMFNHLSKTEKVSRAELFRRAFASYLKPHRETRPLPGFGAWRDTPIDGMVYQEKIRSEWE